MLEIEITRSNIIDGGIEVFARAWQDGVQIGFGEDGTVDIERFRIFNPPVLVLDPTGSIVREQQANEENGITYHNAVYREDYEEALLQTLEHTIKTTARFGDENIISGKTGNTTSTFYPDADPETSSVDGQLNASGSGWSTLRNATGTAVNDTSVTIPIGYLRTSGTTPNLMIRGAFLFDTSSIADGDTISSATFSLYINQIINASAHGGLSVAITDITTASATALANADYDISNFGSRVASDVAFTGYTAGQYYDHTVTDLSIISKTSTSNFGTLTAEEFDNNEPIESSSTTATVIALSADQTGTANDPKLVVEHSAGGPIFTPKVMWFN